MYRKGYKKNVPASRRRKAQGKARLTKSVMVNDNRLFLKRSYVLPDPANDTHPYFMLLSPATWAWRRIAFSIAALPNHSEFQALFNQYKVHALRYDFIPSISETTADQNFNGGSFVTRPRMYTVVDKSGGASITSEAAMLEYSNKKIVDGLNPFSIYINKPEVHVEVETSTLFVGAGQGKNMWLDLDNPQVTFRGCGVGGIIPFANATGTIAYQCICTAYLEFRQAR